MREQTGDKNSKRGKHTQKTAPAERVAGSVPRYLLALGDPGTAWCQDYGLVGLGREPQGRWTLCPPSRPHDENCHH